MSLIRLITKWKCRQRKPFVDRTIRKYVFKVFNKVNTRIRIFSISFFSLLIILSDKYFSLMPHCIIATRLVKINNSFPGTSFFWESLVDLIIYPARSKRRLHGNPFVSSSFFSPSFIPLADKRITIDVGHSSSFFFFFFLLLFIFIKPFIRFILTSVNESKSHNGERWWDIKKK